MRSNLRVNLVGCLSDYETSGIITDRIYNELFKRQVDVMVSPCRYTFVGESEKYNRAIPDGALTNIYVSELDKDVRLSDIPKFSTTLDTFYITWFRGTKISPEIVSQLNKKNATVIVPSEFCLTVLTSHGVECPMYQIPFGVDTVSEDETIDYDPDTDKTRFITVLNQWDDVDNAQVASYLFAAMNQALERSNVELVIKANGVMLNRECTENVKILDKIVPYNSMKALYKQCDYYISLHNSCAFDLDMLTAMSYGLPVIAPRFAGNMEYFSNHVGWEIPYEYGYRNGYLVSVFDVEETMKIVNEAAVTRNENKGRLAYSTAKRYTWYEFVRRLIDVICTGTL